MVTWYVSFERELIKQRSLFDLPMPHHDSQSCLSQRLNQGTSCVATEDFFNKIGQKPTSRPEFCQRFCDLAGALDEPLDEWAQGPVLQGQDRNKPWPPR